MLNYENRSQFTYRADMGDDAGETIIGNLAGVEDLEVAEA
jgi:hypothetical protein